MSTAYQTPEADLTARGMVNCNACQHELHSSAASCPHCGASRRTSRYKSKNVAALLALFLGGFGAHRFYLGQWWGIFYLLFFWLWIPGLVALIECIVFLVRGAESWDEKYNEGIPAGPTESGGGAAVAVLAVLGVFITVAVIGILAAIALPAYQDYITRAKVSEALIEVEPIQTRVGQYYFDNGALPETNAAAALEAPFYIGEGNTVNLTPNGINITFGAKLRAIESDTLVLSPVFISSELSWDCTGGSLDNRYRPTACKN